MIKIASLSGVSVLGLIFILHSGNAFSYPIDAYDETHIRRLASANRDALPAGARLASTEIRVSGRGLPSLPPADPLLSSRLGELVGEQAQNYSIAVLDISTPGTPRFMVHNPDVVANIGSVGKLIVMYALLDKLARLYPDDIDARIKILRESMVTADDWIISDSHVVPVFDTGEDRIMSRRLQPGDTGNLWEYLDWMMSASSNAAASMVIQQVILLERFGRDYPLNHNDAAVFLKSQNPVQLGRLWLSAAEPPLTEAGFDINGIRQGGPFTATASGYVQGTSSVGNVVDLVKILNLIESGRFVDNWSSAEAKRLLYMTQKRIRYASHPVLNNAAVYFKSGSFYSCMPEPEFVCRQYMGNRVNRLASIAIIESPAGTPSIRYLVAVMSNVLRVNSAVAHQTLAARIHELIVNLNKQ